MKFWYLIIVAVMLALPAITAASAFVEAYRPDERALFGLVTVAYFLAACFSAGIAAGY